jgi:hypothetical protein
MNGLFASLAPNFITATLHHLNYAVAGAVTCLFFAAGTVAVVSLARLNSKPYWPDSACPRRGGARPLRRFISREVETRIGRALLSGDILDGAVIHVGYDAGGLAVG